MKGFQHSRWYQSIKHRLKSRSAAEPTQQPPHESGVQVTKTSAGEEPRLSVWQKSRKIIYISAAVLLTAGGIFTANRQYVNANTVSFYHVYVNGESIGSIQDDNQLDELFASKQQYYEEKYPDANMVLFTEGITTKMDRDYKPDIQPEATLDKLDGMLKAYARGVELKLDGEVIAIVKDQETAQAVMAAAKAKFAPEPETVQAAKTSSMSLQRVSASAGDSDSAVKIKEEFTISSTKADPNKVLDLEAAVELLTTAKDKPVRYTVQEGDTISSIAREHGMNSEDVLKLNPGLQEKYVQIGTELTLTSPTAPLTVQTVEMLTEKMPSKPEIEVRKSDELPLGKRKVVRPGRDGVKEVQYRVIKENGRVVSREWIGQEVVQPSLPEVVYKGTKVEKKAAPAAMSAASKAASSSGKKFTWPVSGARITSSYGPRWGRKHEGVDLVGGRTIMAAAGGKVIFAGTQGTYGKAVIIDHGDGYQTLYGHLSSISVRSGQSISQGGKVGIMGSTGRSTGIHLHFEIRKNGNQLNPMQYL
ncbi:M23 family metallopeptidase [Paenibacillus lemnae]|uniref:Peptidoglycan DD-metalloendopeptidase family protein n=1 Tax=Paenibacillus lemnae TaxID=1330551 RepID=A0A848M088_PAELE|nr:M23 family metallopeptidase [Paenibacillus lemnae]NMO94217.1 peptidoglycan DD-metalloendopeptidase family protein [Paenibacillus lemnae]